MNRTRSVNQYLTHWIYPYKGKFHPQMIRALMNIIGLKRGDLVLDPFIGSGTTALEAQLLGINCIGIDISPLCVLQSKVKTESIDVLPQIKEWERKIV
jgi:tRNA G10  N-methylase Trm11